MDYILNKVKEKGIVDIIEGYKKDLELYDKIKKLNIELYKKYNYMCLDNVSYSSLSTDKYYKMITYYKHYTLKYRVCIINNDYKICFKSNLD